MHEHLPLHWLPHTSHRISIPRQFLDSSVAIGKMYLNSIYFNVFLQLFFKPSRNFRSISNKPLDLRSLHCIFSSVYIMLLTKLFAVFFLLPSCLCMLLFNHKKILSSNPTLSQVFAVFFLLPSCLCMLLFNHKKILSSNPTLSQVFTVFFLLSSCLCMLLFNHKKILSSNPTLSQVFAVFFLLASCLCMLLSNHKKILSNNPTLSQEPVASITSGRKCLSNIETFSSNIGSFNSLAATR